MRGWWVVASGVAFLALGFWSQGCGRHKGPAPETRTTLPEPDRTALLDAAAKLAEAAGKGDSAALSAGINPNLPKREAQFLEAAVSALHGKPALKATVAAGLSTGGAVVTLEGGGLIRTWRFDKIAGQWKLSSTN